MKKLTAILLVLVLLFTTSATTLAVGGSTNVTVTIDSSQISVTVPTALSIEAKVDGGPATVATLASYKITNNSLIPLKVDTIAVAFKNGVTNWVFKGTEIAAGVAPVTSNKNDIYLSINGQVMEVQSARTPTTTSLWNIPAHDGTTAGELLLPVAASTSRLNQTTSEADLITITYVISAGSY